MGIKINLNDYPEHKNSVINIITSIMNDEPELYQNEMVAFNYFTASLFANSTQDEYFSITDGKSDQGIDFYTDIDDCIEIYQCKFAEFDTIQKSNKPLKFDETGVRDLENAYNYIFSDEVTKTASQKIKKIRAKIILSNCLKITFSLCVFGELTEDAKNKFDILKQKYSNDKVNFNLIQWKDIFKELILQSQSPSKIQFKFRVNDNQILSKNDYTYFLTHALDLYRAFEEYGWSLFDLNVRSELKNSPINKSIIDSLTHTKSMKNFHHLNNGILIFAEICEPIDENKMVQLTNFQIINGCQTVRSIHRAVENLTRNKKNTNEFDKKCLVQVKVIKKNKYTAKLIDDIIVSSNNQNSMSPRNLKSNTDEQRKIKSMFDSLNYKWFYQRKDGEFESYKKLPKIGNFKFTLSNYKGKKSYRFIDNSELAKTWICFIGFSHEAMMTSDYFKKQKLYEDIFNTYPSDELWYDFANYNNKFKRKDNYFIINRKPSAEEYLLSFLIWTYIKNYSLSPVKNRNEALERGVNEAKKLTQDETGKIKDSKERQANYLITDTEYMVNNIINNSKEVMLEMFSYILILKYGHGYEVAKSILQNKYINKLVIDPDFKEYIANEPKEPENILYSIYEFLKFVLNQLYIEIKGDYIAASRRKSYLSTPNFCQKFKCKINEINNNDDFRIYMKSWKYTGKNFIESLPNL